MRFTTKARIKASSVSTPSFTPFNNTLWLTSGMPASTRRAMALSAAGENSVVGSRVRVTNVPAAAHTRLPGYLRGREGTVERVFEGDYAYFCHTGDGIGDPMPNLHRHVRTR